MKTITITKDELQEAIITANREFMEKGKKLDDPTAEMMMSLQNMIFGALLTNVLFDEIKEDK